jgi:hypothetical protein
MNRTLFDKFAASFVLLAIGALASTALAQGHGGGGSLPPPPPPPPISYTVCFSQGSMG